MDGMGCATLSAPSSSVGTVQALAGRFADEEKVLHGTGLTVVIAGGWRLGAPGVAVEQDLAALAGERAADVLVRLQAVEALGPAAVDAVQVVRVRPLKVGRDEDGEQGRASAVKVCEVGREPGLETGTRGNWQVRAGVGRSRRGLTKHGIPPRGHDAVAGWLANALDQFLGGADARADAGY